MPDFEDDAIEVELAASTQPARIELRFATPYAYRAAHLLGQFDAHARRLLTARHIGFVAPNVAADSLRRCAHAIRASFAIPQQYRVFGVDRCGYTQGTPAAERARGRMGEVPVDVLEGRTLASVRPRRAMSRIGLSDQSLDAASVVPIDDVAILDGNDGPQT